MSKKSKLITIVLSLAVILLAAVYAAVAVNFGESENTTADGGGTEDLEIVTGFDASSAVSLRIITRDNDDVYLKDSGAWICADGREIMSTYPQTSATALEKITVCRMISDGSYIDEGYGFSSPTLKVIAICGDGEEYVFIVGAKNYLSDEYYLRIGEDGCVYMIEGLFLEYFDYTPESIIKPDDE